MNHLHPPAYMLTVRVPIISPLQCDILDRSEDPAPVCSTRSHRFNNCELFTPTSNISSSRQTGRSFPKTCARSCTT
jgi:hypothetical protein